MQLEERVTKGNVVYLHRIERDVANKRLVFTFCATCTYVNPVCISSRTSYPDETQIVRKVTFAEVENFVENWHEEPDTTFTEQLLGIAEKTENGTVRCWIALYQSEMCFTSRTQPQIVDLDGQCLQ